MELLHMPINSKNRQPECSQKNTAKNHIFGLRIKNDHTRQKKSPDRTDERGTKIVTIMSAVILTPQGVDIE